jgi:hypothetical protein
MAAASLAGAFAGLAGVGWLTVPAPPAEAVDPPILAAFRAKLAATNRLYVILGLPTIPVSGVDWTLAIRADLPSRRMAMQLDSGANYVYQDGVLTMSAAGLPVRLEAFEPYFAWFLEELDTGFADATFTPERLPNDDRVVDGPTGIGWGTFRVTFPTPLDDPFRIYLTLHDPAWFGNDETCRVESLVIFPATGGTPSTLYTVTLPFVDSPNPAYGWSPLTSANLGLCEAIQWEPVWSESIQGAPDPWSTRLSFEPGFKAHEYGGLPSDDVEL